jgi:long-chain acyl-CoA synthetase
MLRTELIAPIPDLLRRHAAARPDKLAFRDVLSSITYGSLLRSTAALAGHLRSMGLENGDRVALWLPNSVQWAESCLAIARAGGISVPISYDASESEALYRLTDSGCRMVITTDERALILAVRHVELPAMRATILVDCGAPRADGPRYRDLVSRAAAAAPPDPTSLDDAAFILYTSGTTGRAKGVVLSTRSMLWVTAACWAPIAGLAESDYVLSPLPLFHSYALNLSVLSVLAVGASEYIMEKYSTSECLALLQQERFTLMPGVPTMFHYLLEAARDGEAPRFRSLRLCISAGAIMPATLNRDFERRFSVPLLDGYGITETATMVTMNWPVGTRVMGSCGLPVPGLAVRIVDPLTRADLPAGQEGELIVRGPNLMLGYHGKPAETAQALRDGWYHTGDLAKSDPHGMLTITGRLKELIIRGGQNIAPAEIEEAALRYHGIVDCAVVGVAHPHLGEVPVMFVVARDGHRLDAEALLSHCRSELSAYKVPQEVHVIDQIPRTGSGKIMRFKLSERLRAG